MKQSVAKTKYQCVLCLRGCGFGMTRITRSLQMGKAAVSRVFRANGIAIRPDRNGVALKGSRLRAKLLTAITRIKKRQAKRLKELASAMGAVARRERAGRCSRKGMTKAQVFVQRYHNELVFRITHILRARVRKVVKRGDRYSRHTLDWLGCSPAELISHLEAQWTEGMSWKNFGIGKGKWNVDHDLPCAAFDLTNSAHQAICFHWSNLCPLWSEENGRKRDSFDKARLALILGSLGA